MMAVTGTPKGTIMVEHKKRLCARAGAAATLLLSFWAIGLRGETQGRQVSTSPDDIAYGFRLFRTMCANCHARSGTGGRGPALRRGIFRYASSDEALFKVINEGIPRVGMPNLAVYGYPEEDVWRVVSFVRSLSRQPVEVKLSGDAETGERLFEEADCGTCHMVNGEGGRLGPDLSDIGWLRSPKFLRVSLLTPDEDVLPRWWQLWFRLRDGTEIEGLRVDEDTSSVRIMDYEENLRSFLKRDLVDLERIEESTMPSYEGVLEESQLDDLVAYLYSLRGRQQ